MMNTYPKTCLNGWWDFLPLTHLTPGSTPPPEGWEEGAYMVPSVWTKSMMGYRRKKTRGPFVCINDAYDPSQHARLFDGDYEFLFDAYGYPDAWSKTRSAWARRTFDLEAVQPGRSYHLVFEAIAPRSVLFLNGREAGRHQDAFTPFKADVTTALQPGSNELAVLVLPYEESEKGRTLTPSGNMFTRHFAGIWQDVWLEERGEVFVSDVVIRTSTRQRQLEVIFELTNATDEDRTVEVDADVRPWHRTEERAPVLGLAPFSITVPPGKSARHHVAVAWEDPEWWYPERPFLYQLLTRVRRDSGVVDVHAERFGFREVWLDGPHLMLNDYPLHLFSDWGHKLTSYHHTEAWNRQWFGMIRDGHMNHSRLHTHPHPRLILDLADEEGLLITGETGVHGSNAEQEADAREYWEAARDHVRAYVRRDKNHPCIVLWSVENEMRWNGDKTALTQKHLPELRALFEQLDPTRPAYHEGDSSMWDEQNQPMLSRHYGKDCSGLGWWDRRQPLHAGEMALYHYAGPNNTCHLRGDRVYRDFRHVDEAAAEDAARIIEAGRTRGVCCFGPWNQSCLENLRMDDQYVQLEVGDPAAPGIKPLRVAPHASEFAFWKEGKGYTPNYGFDIQKHAFRPLAVIDLSLRTEYFAGAEFKRNLHLVNDTTGPVSGSLVATLSARGQVVHEQSWELSCERGAVSPVELTCRLPDDLAEPTVFTYTVRFEGGDAAVDAWSRLLHVEPPCSFAGMPAVAVFGQGDAADFLRKAGVGVETLDDLASLELDRHPVLVMEGNSVVPKSSQNLDVQSYARAGGRVLLMEQPCSLFPGLEMESMPVLQAFVRHHGHPVLEGLEESRLANWGDDPYALLSSDATVATHLYRKADGRHEGVILEAGEGTFHGGDLELSPLLEIPEGQGVILACQLRLTEKLATIPSARRLLRNLLQYLCSYQHRRPQAPLVQEKADRSRVASLAEAAAEGRTVIVSHPDDDVLRAWSETLEVDLRLSAEMEEYQAVPVKDGEPLLAGVSACDCCGIETFSYAPPAARNYRLEGRALEPAEGLEALLETPTESCLKELYAWNGKVEPLRAHTQSRYLHADRPHALVLLGRVRHGKGQVLFNLFRPPEDAPIRMHRPAHRLFTNTGGRYEGSLLDGPCVPEARGGGPGYPEAMWVLREALTPELRTTLTACTAYIAERMEPAKTLASAKWERVATPEGNLTAEAEQETIVAYFRLLAPRARKNVELDMDVPNPEALTFIDFEGEGEVQVWVNAKELGKVEVNGTASLADIELENGHNQVLFVWKPGCPAGGLRLRWRNIFRRAETEFVFS